MTEHAVPGGADSPVIRIDAGRRARTGVAEAVYGPGKSPRQCADAVAELLANEGAGPVLLTRADSDQAALASERSPGAVIVGDSGRGEELATLVWRRLAPLPGRALVLTAGTADLTVAREAEAVLAAYGYTAELVADVGVAGLHRILAHQTTVASADVVIIVAGMEGALASVATGLTRAPVIAVPTSTGYGAAFEGVTALLAMLASCSPGVSVVGIDNGFGAGCAAVRILNAFVAHR